jgi:hypothetical protein
MRTYTLRQMAVGGVIYNNQIICRIKEFQVGLWNKSKGLFTCSMNVFSRGD